MSEEKQTAGDQLETGSIESFPTLTPNAPDALSSCSVASSSRAHKAAPDLVLDELCRNMISSTGDYIKSEIDICLADYKTLERMNRTVTDRYKSLDQCSANISGEMARLNEAYAGLLPLLTQIDNVDSCVSEFEQAANKLDAYSKKLESRFKQFSEKHLSASK